MKSINSPNTVCFNGFVSREDRERLNGHRGGVLWFTGLSASGKSTIAHYVERELHRLGCSTYVFDGDNVRHGLCGDLGFSPQDRAENLRRIGEMVKLFVDAGLIVLTAFVSPYEKDRLQIRKLFLNGEFTEVFVDCPLEICQQRDNKGNYKKAKAGIIKDYTGISAPYERPKNPDLLIKTHDESLESSVARIISYIADKGWIEKEEPKGISQSS